MYLFIDYVPLLLINMAAALCMLAWFVYEGLDATDQKPWVPGFAITGFVAVVCGLHMSWTWPLPGSHNIAFGEMSVLLGVLLLGAALALGKGWDLRILGVYGFLAGLCAIVLSIRIFDLGMTQLPFLTSAGFLLTGAGGIGVLPVLYNKSSRRLRIVGAVVLLAAALIWTFVACTGYWFHLSVSATWTPAAKLVP